MNKLVAMFSLVALSAMSLAARADGVQVLDAKLGKGVQDHTITEEASTFAVNDKVYLLLKLSGGPADAVKVTGSSATRSIHTLSKSAAIHGALSPRRPRTEQATGPSRSPTQAVRC